MRHITVALKGYYLDCITREHRGDEMELELDLDDQEVSGLRKFFDTLCENCDLDGITSIDIYGMDGETDEIR